MLIKYCSGVRCAAAQFGTEVLTLQHSLLSLSSGCASMLHRKEGTYLPIYTASRLVPHLSQHQATCTDIPDRQVLQNIRVPEDDIGKQSKYCTGSLEQS